MSSPHSFFKELEANSSIFLRCDLFFLFSLQVESKPRTPFGMVIAPFQGLFGCSLGGLDHPFASKAGNEKMKTPNKLKQSFKKDLCWPKKSSSNLPQNQTSCQPLPLFSCHWCYQPPRGAPLRPRSDDVKQRSSPMWRRHNT